MYRIEVNSKEIGKISYLHVTGYYVNDYYIRMTWSEKDSAGYDKVIQEVFHPLRNVYSILAKPE